jgi:hypothetical protein
MLDWDCIAELKKTGRARVWLGRVPIWLDAPREEEGVWLSVVLPEVSAWAEGRRSSVLRMLQRSPDLRDCLHLAGQQVLLRTVVPKNTCSPPVLRSALENILRVAHRWRRWLLVPSTEQDVVELDFS